MTPILKSVRLAMMTAAAAAALPILAHADDAAPASSNDQTQQLQEVVVTGIKESLEASIDVKRNANSFVDAINAEDVGKLPDANIAEVLQRVPGVTIQRTLGEGDFISIRGLGPNFVRGEIDGRTIVSATETSDQTRNGGVFDSTGRATNFDILPSEIVRELEVIKSPTAAMVEGGIGGVVDVKTQEPLQLGTRSFLSANGEYRGLGHKVDPDVSGLTSWKNADGNFAILADLSYSRRSIREDGVNSYGWATPTNWAATPNIDSTGSGVPNLVGQNMVWTLNPEQEFATRDRLTGQTKAQWRFADDSQLTANLLYSRRTTVMQDLWGTLEIAPTGFVNPPPALVPPGQLGQSMLGNCVTNPPAGGFCTVPGATASNGKITSLQVATSNTDNFDLQHQGDTMTVAGLNYRKILGRWSLDGDLSYSGALGTMYELGDDVNLAYVTPWQMNSYADMNQMTPIGSPNLSSPSLYYTRGLSFTYRRNSQSEKAASFDAKRDLENVPLSRALELGFRVAQRTVNRRQDFDPNSHGGNFLLTGYNGIYPTRDWGDGTFGTPFSQLFFLPPSTYQTAIQALDPTHNTAFGPSQFDPLNSYGIKEDTYAFYIQDDLRAEFAGMPLTGNVGVRGVETDTTTTGYYEPFNIVFSQSQNLAQFLYTSPNIVSTDLKNSYFNLLPELNLVLNIRDNLLVRFAAGKSLTRPDYQTQLAPALTGINAQNRSASAGNPYLKAYGSTSVDLGLEWYPGHGSALWAAVFHKTINDFIGESTEFNVSRFNYTWTSLNTPENQGTAKIDGAELGIQYIWPIGFGFSANTTLVTSSANYTSGVNAGKTLPFDGVSRHSYNGEVFYEKGGFNARLAYDYRSEYVVIGSDVFGNTEWNAPYGQLDGSVSYAINDAWTIVGSAVDLTNAANRLYTIQPGYSLAYSMVGRRWDLGFRAKF